MSLRVRPVVPSRLTPGGHNKGRTPRSVLGGYIALMKLRVVELLLITTVPTMVLAEGGWPSFSLILITLLGGTLGAGGANAINMYIDRDIDGLMERTKNRPLVTGLIAPRHALIFAMGLEIVSFGVLWAGANLAAAALCLSATLFYVPMLPVVESEKKVIRAMIGYCAATVAASLALIPVAGMGWVYTVLAIVLGAAFLGGTIALGRKPSPAASMKLFSFSISYLSLVFVGLTIDVLVR